LKLYEIPLEFAVLETALVESDGELTPELEKQLDEFLRSGKDKLEGGAMVMRGLEMEAAACRTEALRLAQRADSIDKNVGRLKGLILYALDGAFGGKVKTALFTIWGQTSAVVMNLDLAPGVELTDLPENFVRTKRELAKDAVKEAIKKGEPIPDEIIVSEVPGTRFLRVK
jgi:Siphovirus Gp157